MQPLSMRIASPSQSLCCVRVCLSWPIFLSLNSHRSVSARRSSRQVPDTSIFNADDRMLFKSAQAALELDAAIEEVSIEISCFHLLLSPSLTAAIDSRG